MDAHKNFSYSTVATAPSPATSGTSLVVATGDGAKFPSAPFNATVWPAGAQATTANAEIVRVTAVSTDTLTITRAQESTSARTIVVGDQVQAGITAKTLTDVEAGANLAALYLKPSAAKYETYSRAGAAISSPDNLNTGALFLTAIALPANAVISNIAFMSSGAAGSPTHWWYSLCDSSRVQLAVTADQTTTALGANTLASLPIATIASGAASSFTTTYEGLYYLGFMMTATTMCTLQSINSGTSGPLTLTPALCGKSSLGQTTPPAFPFTAASLTFTIAPIYAYVS